jgi:hypothetical protein
VSDLLPLLCHPLHGASVSSSTGDLPWGPSLSDRYSLLRYTFAAHRSPSLATRPSPILFLHWLRYSDSACPRALGASLAWFIAHRCTARCRLRPRGVGFALVYNVLAAWPAPGERGSALSQKNGILGAACQIQGYTLHLAVLAVTPFRSLSLVVSTTERLTGPYSGGLAAVCGSLLDG